jgi:hypothetical protein
MRAQLSNHDYELLSAYLDRQLAPSEQKKLEERLHARPELQQALEEMNSTRMLLRSAPRRRAPRNFTLTPAMVGEHKRAREQSWFSGLFPTLSFASAVATFALILSLVFELLPGTGMTSMTAQPQADTVAMEPLYEMAEAPAGEARMAPEEAPMAAGELEVLATQEAPTAEEPSEGFGIAAVPEVDMKAEGEFSGEPIFNWQNDGAGSPPGMGGGGYAAMPRAWGMGGAGDEYFDPYAMDRNLVIPLEGAASLADMDLQAATLERGAMPPSDITGNGPILGVPAPEDGGKIQIQSSWGLPIEIISGPAAEYTGGSSVATGSGPTLFGLPGLRVAQGLLALLAVSTAAAAVFIRRRTAHK